MKTIRIPYGDLGISEPSVEGLAARLELGIVDFTYYKKDGSFRRATGTRNLFLSDIDFSLVPMNLKTVPPHLLSYIDMNCADGVAWRCFIKDALLYYGEEIEVDDTFATDDNYPVYP